MSEAGPTIEMNEQEPSYSFSIKEILEEDTTPEWFRDLSQQNEYINSFLLEIIAKQAMQIDTKTKEKYIDWTNLWGGFTDIDGTMTVKYRPTAEERQTDDAESLRKKELDFTGPYTQAVDSLVQRLAKKNRPLFAVSGRDLPDIQAGQSNGPAYGIERLPHFPACASAVGTEIYVLQHDGSYALEQEWANYIKDHIHFNREVMYGQPSKEDQLPNGCFALLESLSRFNLQIQKRDLLDNVIAWQNNPENIGKTNPDKKPQQNKISFVFEGNMDDVAEVRKSFQEMLNSSEINAPNVKIIISYDRDLADGRFGFNVDLIPVSKLDAINFMQKKYHLSAIVAGDSGNDEDMIFNAGAGIIVQGAKRELAEAADKHMEADLIRRTKHFVQLHSRDTNTNNLIIINAGSGEGPISLDRAAHAFELLDAVTKKTA